MATITPATGMPIGEARRSSRDVMESLSKSGGGDDIEKNRSEENINEETKTDADSSSERKQEGVLKVEAVTSVWTKKWLWITFALLYLLTFVDSLMGSVQGTVSPYVTSAFGQHGLLGTTSIVSTILGGICTLTIAKIINIWGRVQGLAAAVVLITLGMIMKATCQNVETYAAAQVLYWIGHIAMLFIINVTLSDMTTLKNRMIMLGFNTTPTIATYWAGPKIAERFLLELNFRWAFGALAVILVGVCLPVGAIFVYNERKAKKLGVLRAKSGRTAWESTKFYLVEFDVVGLLLITTGWALLLLPFSLVDTTPGGWSSYSLIIMFVFGPVLLALFYVWERWYAPVAFFPWKYLTDRTILGSCLTYGFMFASIFCWDTYYGSYLQVAHYQSIANSGYVLNAFSLTSSFISTFIGIAIRYTGNVKWIAMIGMPFLVLGTALLVRFRTPDTSIGVLVMLQVFNGISSAFFAQCSQISIMSVVGHNEIAVGLALHGLFGGIGAAIGMAIAAAIWTNVLPFKIAEFLPESAKDQAATLYGDISAQLLAEGEVREAVIAAYSDVQHKMVIAGCAFVPCVLISLLVWRNVNVKKLEKEKGPQTKGNVW